MMKERPDAMRRILLTGAAGAIGSVLAKQLPKENEIWRLNDIKQLGEPGADTIEHMSGDLTDYDFVLELCKDVDTIIHLAGQPKEGPWPSLLGPNIICSANLWEAARVNDVKRIIYGSSNHVNGMYPTTSILHGNESTRPDSRYGVTKVFGEGLASHYSDKHNISTFVIRIGSFQLKPRSLRELYTWISPRDMCALVRTGLEAKYRHAIVFGISGNSRSWYDNSLAFSLGYEPTDNSEEHVDCIANLVVDPANPIDMLQGGGSSGREFEGDLPYLLNRMAAREL
ncbi:NAD(P)-dependent oxidoreductase [uncultured Cohaesibacter sp.]|uniref:NAD-dependent epimerase/dehydratase family protein n=1 Tax=uncultured Cohaesibacter sp. TaxID=1002546 RepID=UPI00292EBE05|nr:NAD(P)-dependent oxidoreductase [uncultured Cohaesibacter sp.]